jgi:hypothetical protein
VKHSQFPKNLCEADKIRLMERILWAKAEDGGVGLTELMPFINQVFYLHDKSHNKVGVIHLKCFLITNVQRIG